MKRQAPLFALALSLVCAAAVGARAQSQSQSQPVQSDEVLQVNTRVVFLDALVNDKKTKATASDLALENFQVLADGQPRKVTYFSREGDATRRPLALVLVFDLERIGSGRYLRRTDIIEAMAKELERLPPGDEVAILVLDPGGQEGKRQWLTGFTRNRAQLASAMSIIPTLVGEGGTGEESITISVGDSHKKRVEVKDEPRPQDGSDGRAPSQDEAKRTAEAASNTAMILKASKGELDEGDELDTVVNSKGEKLTRILKADGTLVVTHVNKKGEEESEVYNDFDLPRATYEITKRVARERPNSQAAVVYVTDGLAPMQFGERDYVEDRLNRHNVIFSALVTDMKTGLKLAKPLLSPLGNWAGVGIYGVVSHVSAATGGDVVRVHGPADYARGLSQIIGDLNARYSLGFTLADAETDDGRMHALEVRVAAKDAKGKDRKFQTKARRGYFMPAAPKSQEAQKADAAKAEAQTKNQ